jgi:hypothetical protein
MPLNYAGLNTAKINLKNYMKASSKMDRGEDIYDSPSPMVRERVDEVAGRETEMSRALAAHSMEVDKLAELVNILSKQLYMVSREPTENKMADPESEQRSALGSIGDKQFSSPRAGQLAAQTRKVREIRNKVENTLNYLEV